MQWTGTTETGVEKTTFTKISRCNLLFVNNRGSIDKHLEIYVRLIAEMKVSEKFCHPHQFVFRRPYRYLHNFGYQEFLCR